MVVMAKSTNRKMLQRPTHHKGSPGSRGIVGDAGGVDQHRGLSLDKEGACHGAEVGGENATQDLHIGVTDEDCARPCVDQTAIDKGLHKGRINRADVVFSFVQMCTAQISVDKGVGVSRVESCGQRETPMHGC